jgi:hypothetical protein
VAADLRERVARAIARDENGDETGWQAWLNEADAVLAELGQPQASAEDVELVDQCVLKGEHYDGELHEAWQRIEADMRRLLGGVK